jgi:hypothetical protein
MASIVFEHIFEYKGGLYWVLRCDSNAPGACETIWS